MSVSAFRKTSVLNTSRKVISLLFMDQRLMIKLPSNMVFRVTILYVLLGSRLVCASW